MSLTSLPKACIIDASILLDYYRHSTGADYYPQSLALVNWAVDHFDTVYAEFLVGHSRFADILRINTRFSKKLRLVTQSEANQIVDDLSPKLDAIVAATFDRVMADGTLTAFRTQRAREHVRPPGDDVGYVLRLTILAKAFNAAVVLAQNRLEIGNAIGRSSVRSERTNSSDVKIVTALLGEEFTVVFAGLSSESAEGRQLGYALILKGGGVKGVAFAGALQELQPYFSFHTFVGTSAGAIVAALLGAGFSASELEDILARLQLRQFVNLNPVSIIRNLLFRGGLFDTALLQEWVEENLRRKMEIVRDVTFKDLPFEVRIPVSTRRRGTVVFGKRSHPHSSVSFAVRCSASIPFFFVPCDWEGDIAVDGGVQNNLPIRPYLEGGGDDRVVILSLNSPAQERRAQIGPLFRVTRGLAAIWLAQDEDALTAAHANSVVNIDTGRIRTTQLSLSSRDREFLLVSGRLAAVTFLQRQGISGLEVRRGELDQQYRTLAQTV